MLLQHCGKYPLYKSWGRFLSGFLESKHIYTFKAFAAYWFPLLSRQRVFIFLPVVFKSSYFSEPSISLHYNFLILRFLMRMFKIVYEEIILPPLRLIHLAYQA